jgi:uncharacterized RmlC-like cupin family protein
MSDAVRIVRAHQRGEATTQTRGMKREVGVAPETTGSRNLWMGLVTTPAGMVSSWHHHGDCESGIYVMRGRARFRWGKGGVESAEVAAGSLLRRMPFTWKRLLVMRTWFSLSLAPVAGSSW